MTATLIVHVVFLCMVWVKFASAQGPHIGIYGDAAGSSCSFSGDETGPITVYVVVKPDANGVRGARFAAPIPSCFKATFLGETVADGMAAIGNSQTGISIATGMCESTPLKVLEITYMRSGGTAPCCEFPLVSDPAVSGLEAVDCAFNTEAMTSAPSHFNANETCPCSGETAPLAPMNPQPLDGSTAQSVYSTLRWDATDYDGDLVNYDVYLGHDPAPPLVAAAVTDKSYQPPTLDPVSTYYWRVIARDSKGNETSGPTWSFSTRLANTPPGPPTFLSPGDQAINVGLNSVMWWSATDTDGDSLVYDVYFGTSSPPPLVESDLHFTEYRPALDFSTIYYLKVVVRDAPTGGTAGPTWSFTTRPPNFPPLAPWNPVPATGSADQPINVTLGWHARDDDREPMVYDIYFGTDSLPPLMAADHDTKSYSVSGLNFSTDYYWRVVARDPHGAATSSEVWTFTTEHEVPVTFSSFSASPVAGGVEVRWELRSDESMERYSIYRDDGTTPLGRLIVQGRVESANGSYLDRGAEVGRTYRYEMGVESTDGNVFRSPSVTATIPAVQLTLYQNVPNPFNPVTTVRYDLPGSGMTHVKLWIADIAGHIVRTLVDGNQPGGSHEAMWNGTNNTGALVSSGVYFYVLDADRDRRTRKLVLLK